MVFTARTFTLLALAARAPQGASIALHRVGDHHVRMATRAINYSVTHDVGFLNAELVVNNLGGKGPMVNQAEELRYMYDFPYEGRQYKVDVVIEAETPYEGNTSMNTIVGNYAQINLEQGTDVTLKVSFQTHEDQHPIVVPRFDLAIMDLDHGKDLLHRPAAFEAVLAGPLLSYTVTPTTQLRVSSAPGSHEYFIFNSSQFGGHPDNPSSERPLTREQKNKAVALEFASTSHFRLKLFASPGLTGRTFLLGSSRIFGDTDFHKTDVGPCSDHEKLDLSSSQVVGDLTQNGMRFTNVFPYSNQAVDLVVTAKDDYVPHNEAMNGLSGKCGVINLAANNAADFTFTFVNSGSDTAVQMGKFFFSLLDIDMTQSGNEQVKFKKSEWSNTWLSFNSSLKLGADGDLITENATSFGDGDDLPTDPMTMDDEQVAKSVTFFRRDPIDQFHISFAASEGTFTGRNLLFAGRTNYACPNLV